MALYSGSILSSSTQTIPEGASAYFQPNGGMASHQPQSADNGANRPLQTPRKATIERSRQNETRLTNTRPRMSNPVKDSKTALIQCRALRGTDTGLETDHHPFFPCRPSMLFRQPIEMSSTEFCCRRRINPHNMELGIEYNEPQSLLGDNCKDLLGISDVYVHC